MGSAPRIIQQKNLEEMMKMMGGKGFSCIQAFSTIFDSWEKNSPNPRRQNCATPIQGCQMVSFQMVSFHTKNPTLGKI
jgi:hypothetical protein